MEDAWEVDIDPALRDYSAGGRGPIPVQRMHVKGPTERTPRLPNDMEDVWGVDIEFNPQKPSGMPNLTPPDRASHGGFVLRFT